MAKNAGVQNAGEPNEDIIGSMESEISIGVTHKSECRSTIDVISVTVQDIVHWLLRNALVIQIQQLVKYACMDNNFWSKWPLAHILGMLNEG